MNAKSFLTEYKPQSMMQRLDNVKSLPDVWKAKTPSLARMRKQYGERLPVDYLTLWILAINDMVNVGNKMTAFQMEYTAKLVFKENPLLTIADIKFVFDRAVSGSFGELYNRLDSAMICTWFRKHWVERLEAAEQHSQEKHYNTVEKGGERTHDAEKAKIKAAQLHYLQQKQRKDEKHETNQAGG